jgi:uncharacterized SAM-binding protein YcdF (DUF218 family)
VIVARRPLAPLLAAAAGLPVLAGLALLAGFLWFAHVAAEPASPPPHADGIVVLTGGADRVETALHLLAEDRAGVLLVSGANPAADFSALAQRAHISAGLRDRVTVGHTAADTHGNAAETAAWAAARGLRTLIVVTAGYHMPRALAELGRAMPEMTLFPYPVVASPLRGIADTDALRLLAREYAKFLVVRAGLAPR